MQNIETILKGGHPNSLGNTLEVVEMVLKNPGRLEELYLCYFSDDEVVRMRVSNAIKRITKEKRQLVIPYLDRFLGGFYPLQDGVRLRDHRADLTDDF